MRLTKGKKRASTAAIVVATGGLVAASMMAATGAPAARQAEPSDNTHAQLQPLNNSGVRGNADVHVNGKKLRVSVDARRLLDHNPHAQHIHFGAKARHECPTVRDDDNADHRINTAEGQPAYGPVKVSLTKKGDTSPDSTLAVKRFPNAPEHKIHYDRNGITVSGNLARKIRHGKGVIVIHGIDYNHNGRYDFSAGESELDPSLPAEATDPVTCGVLKPVPAGSGGGGPLPDLPLDGAAKKN